MEPRSKTVRCVVLIISITASEEVIRREEAPSYGSFLVGIYFFAALGMDLQHIYQCSSTFMHTRFSGWRYGFYCGKCYWHFRDALVSGFRSDSCSSNALA